MSKRNQLIHFSCAKHAQKTTTPHSNNDFNNNLRRRTGLSNPDEKIDGLHVQHSSKEIHLPSHPSGGRRTRIRRQIFSTIRRFAQMWFAIGLLLGWKSRLFAGEFWKCQSLGEKNQIRKRPRVEGTFQRGRRQSHVLYVQTCFWNCWIMIGSENVWKSIWVCDFSTLRLIGVAYRGFDADENVTCWNFMAMCTWVENVFIKFLFIEYFFHFEKCRFIASIRLLFVQLISTFAFSIRMYVYFLNFFDCIFWKGKLLYLPTVSDISKLIFTIQKLKYKYEIYCEMKMQRSQFFTNQRKMFLNKLIIESERHM